MYIDQLNKYITTMNFTNDSNFSLYKALLKCDYSNIVIHIVLLYEYIGMKHNLFNKFYYINNLVYNRTRLTSLIILVTCYKSNLFNDLKRINKVSIFRKCLVSALWYNSY